MGVATLFTQNYIEIVKMMSGKTINVYYIISTYFCVIK